MSFKINLSKVLVSDKEVLEKVSEMDIFSYYLCTEIDVRKLYKCPIHEDKTPSLGFYEGNSGIHYKCFGCGSAGNAFNLVSNLYNIGYGKAVQMVIEDLNLSNGSLKVIDKEKVVKTLRSRSETEIITTDRNFVLYDFKYWNQYNISIKTLKYFKVSACKRVYIKNISGYHYWGEDTPSNPIYKFNINNSTKIYRPLNSQKRGKWVTNCGVKDLQGYEQLPKIGNILFITSSLKDVMVLYQLGYNSIAPQGEGMYLPEDITEELKDRFSRIIVFYDNDEPGIKYGEITANNLKADFIHIPTKYCEDGIKDISDFIKNFGQEETDKLIKSLINDR